MSNDVQTRAISTILPFKISGWLTQHWSPLACGARSALLSVQTARMLSLLENMSDHELTRMGISRSDIPGYVKKLMIRE
ncbi:MAG: hypothetical protein ABJH45_14370 [Paracoccaceae bacterium]